jgi:3-phosphoshikimate 1-carboxyvinyltransferase
MRNIIHNSSFTIQNMNLLLNQSIVSHLELVEGHNSQLSLTGSKSETNRLLLLQALYPNITLENSSLSDDSEVMAKALSSNEKIIDVDHAGTAMRFLTAYFAIQQNREVILTGSSRMKERPIKILVDVLRQLGANISYVEKEGFPPIKIIGQNITQDTLQLKADVSSQYISALLLIAPKLKNGLKLSLKGEITSLPYIKMTLALLEKMGVVTSFIGNKIIVKPLVTLSPVEGQQFIIESDWSSASYFYSIVALSPKGTQLVLSSFQEGSLQGDKILVEIYANFGVETVFKNGSIIIKKIENRAKTIHLNLLQSPDIAQTLVVTCFGLGVGCYLKGLHTLKIKETDRLVSMKTELTKLGASVLIGNDSLSLGSSTKIKSDIAISTYQDHRMAMAFAPLALKVALTIKDAEVVSKSYPTFWKDLKTIGFKIKDKDSKKNARKAVSQNPLKK